MARRCGSWDEFHDLFDQVNDGELDREFSGEAPDEELMAVLRKVAARHAVNGGGAMVARMRQRMRNRILDRALDSESESESRDPKRSRTGASDVPNLMEWSDAELLNLLIRVPYAWHDEVRAVCRKFNDLVKSDEFKQMRIEFKCIEHACVFAGGVIDRRPATMCTLLVGEPLAGEAQRRSRRVRDGFRARPIAPLTSPRAAAASVVFENELFVFGGVIDRRDTPTPTVEAYNPRTDEWRSCPPMSEPRSHFAAGVVGDRVVVAGGQGPVDHFEDFNSAEAYEPRTETWTPLPPLPHATSQAAVCVLDGCLFVAGGFTSDPDVGTENGLLDQLQMFDGHCWTLKAPLPTARTDGRMVAFDGHLVLLGGLVEDGEGSLEGVNDILTYDPHTNLWASQPLPASAKNMPHISVAWESSGKLILLSEETGGMQVVLENGTRGGTWAGSQVYFSHLDRHDTSMGPPAGGRLLLG